MRSSIGRVIAAAAFAAGTFAFVSPAAAAISVELSPVIKFEALTTTWGVAMPIAAGHSSGVRRVGRSTHQDLVVTRRPDSFTPSLALSCAGGDDIRTVKVTYTDGATVWQTVSLEGVIITSFEQSAGQSRGDSTEKLSFTFAKVRWETPPVPGGRGNNLQGWDIEQNKKAQLEPTVPPQRGLPDDKRSKEGSVVASAPVLVLPPKATKPTMMASR